MHTHTHRERESKKLNTHPKPAGMKEPRHKVTKLVLMSRRKGKGTAFSLELRVKD